MGEIRIKRVYEPAEQDDGLRVLVDRVWPRGRTRAQVACPVWAKEVTPSTGLRKAFHAGAVDGAEFERLYRAELAGSPALTDLAERVAGALADGNVTLVTAAHLVPHGHAAVLRALLREEIHSAVEGVHAPGRPSC